MNINKKRLLSLTDKSRFLFIFISLIDARLDYASGFGAPTGQTPAHAPHSIHSSALIT